MFVPYDCNNACPFCVNKQEYRDTSGFDLQRCYRSLDLLNRIFPNNDIVLTGGEPLAELEALQDILDHIGEGHHIYINTTMPVGEGQTIEDVAAVLNKYADRISCINVSRHLRHYVRECPDEIFGLLKFRTRINCVVFEDALNGLKAGKSAGMLTVGLTTTNSAERISGLCDLIVDDFTELSFDKLNERLESSCGK